MKDDVLPTSPAVSLLRIGELENAYREADSEWDKIWEAVASDELSDDTW